jgi:GNAT superfamily N-acetyltransferase
MIRFATQEDTPILRRMWKICFDDSDEFTDLYFSRKYRTENTLVLLCGGELVSSLQMLPYTIRFYGEDLPFYYLSGLCTLPGYRSRGFMKQLMNAAHIEMARRGIPLSVLIPAEGELYRFYEKFGYEQVFEAGGELIPLQQLLAEHPRLQDAYAAFDACFRQCDFCVQKTFDDFATIIDEYILDGCPPKTNLSGMARIIDAGRLFNLYRKARTDVDLELSLGEADDPLLIENNVLKTGIRMLCRLLFGFKTKKLGAQVNSFFPECHPVMNLMLE